MLPKLDKFKHGKTQSMTSRSQGNFRLHRTASTIPKNMKIKRPTKSRSKTQTQFQIEDFYLTKLGVNLNKTSRNFQSHKASHLGSLIHNQSVARGSQTEMNKSEMKSVSTNIFTNYGVSHQKYGSLITQEPSEQKPSYGEYVNTMPSEIRLLFHKSVNMKNIFKDFDRAYYCLEEVKERVKCYKVELGVIMEHNVINLKRIIDRMLLNASRIINDHKQTNDQITKKNLKEMESVVKEKEFFQRRNKQLDQLLDMYKCERDYLEHHMISLKNEIQ